MCNRDINSFTERLAESLRVPQAPSVMAQVFLCFRVLILRISPQHLTSMWPTIITELVSSIAGSNYVYEILVSKAFEIFLAFKAFAVTVIIVRTSHLASVIWHAFK